MKKIIFIFLSLIILVGNLTAQIPESGSFQFLQNAYSKRNSDVMNYLIDECNHYLTTYWDSPNTDQVLYILGNLYDEEKEYENAFLTYLKIKFMFPNSDRRNDSVSNLNQIVHNKAEKMFRDKRKDIDELVSQTLSYNDLDSAFYDYLKFLFELNIDNINEVLINQINFYAKVYAKEVSNPDQIYYWIGDLYKKLSNYEEAILAFQKIRYISPESILIPQSLYHAGVIQYQETREYEKAKDTFVELISAHPEISISGDAQFYLAELYQNKLDNSDEAVSNYRVLVETYPDNRFAVESLKRVAEIMQDKDNYEEAIASYYQIFELYPKNTYAPDALLEIESLYRKKLENYEKSIEVLKLFAEQFPSHEDAAEHLFDAGDIYEDDLNNKQAAIAMFHEVINKFPNSKYAKKAKDRIEDLSEE